jgi:hypothetical protein
MEEVKGTAPMWTIGSATEGGEGSQSGNLDLFLFREETCSDTNNSVDPAVASPASHPPN